MACRTLPAGLYAIREQSGRAGLRSRVVVVPVEDQLGLRDDGSELAVAAGDARLQHDGGAAAVQRHADGMRGVALRHAGEEIGLALDGRVADTVGRADTRSA